MSSNEYSHLDIITYGCSSHILNLLAHDLEDTVIKNKVKQIIKYFKFHHFPAAKNKELGGSSLVLPFDVRWNTMFDSLQPTSIIGQFYTKYVLIIEQQLILR